MALMQYLLYEIVSYLFLGCLIHYTEIIYFSFIQPNFLCIICLSFHFVVIKLGIRERYFPSLAFRFDLVALTANRLGHVCAIECNSGCLVLRFAAVSRAVTGSFNVSGRAVGA